MQRLMPPPSAGRLFLIDGSSQMYRAYHAIRGLTGPDGRSTNAVYGFITMLRKLIADHQPELIVAAFDLAGPTFRSELAHDYKANRAPMPPDLVEQVPLVHEACEAIGVPVLTSETYEADDVIGTLAMQAVAEELEVVIVTSDKDFFQLVGGPIRVFDPRDTGSWYDSDAVKEKMGVTPAQVIDVLSLMGDAVDNVKGVPGIGEKGARELIGTFGSLDGLLQRASEIPKKRYRTALLTHADAARQSQDLIRIRTDAPVPFQPDALRYRGPDATRCFELFSALGFRTLIAEYAPTANTVDKDYAIVRSVSELDALINTVRSRGLCGIRVIGDSSDAMRAGLVGITLSTELGHARYIPIGHRALGDVRDIDAVTALASLAPVLEDSSIRKIGHNLKPDCLILGRRGLKLGGLDLDTMLLSYLLDSTRSTHKLDDLSLEQLGYRPIATEDLLGRGAKALNFSDLPSDAILDYAGEQSDVAIQLAERMAPRLTVEGVAGVYAELERPLVPVLIAIEREGVGIDTEALAAMSTRVGRKLDAHQREIHDLAGVEFNINSPKQLSEVLFDRLQLPALKRTGKTRAASTSVQVLEELALVHELPRKVLEWRRFAETQGHLHRRTATPGQSRDRAGAHVVQPGGGSDRSSQQQRSQPPKHPDSDGAWTRDPPGICGRRRGGPDLGRLLSDRAARPRAPLGRRDVDRRLSAGRGYPPADRRPGVWPGQRAGPARATSSGQDRQLRPAVREDCIHACAGHRCQSAVGAGVHRRLLRGLSGGADLYRCRRGTGPRNRRGYDDVRSPPARA